MRSGWVLGLALTCATGGARADAPQDAPQDPRENGARPVVVVDAGHGGDDFGARGPGGVLEKDVALSVARALGAALAEAGYRVAFTRDADRFVTLVERTEVAARADGDLFLSIHANSSADPEASGIETYFLSIDPTDEDSLQVAHVENAPLWGSAALPGTEMVLGSILQDLAWTAHLEGSSRLAAEVQRRLSRLPSPSRGVKQAPFVVLMGVNMPAILVEIGFLTHAEEARRLRDPLYQRSISQALSAAILSYFDGKGPPQ
jgi:N-acetylmuramoyl-L-alanine amidase